MSPFQQTRITTVASVGNELWVGLGNGQVLIFDVVRNDKYEKEAYVVIEEPNEPAAASEGTPETDSGKYLLVCTWTCRLGSTSY